jgi:hypothetical protein
MFFIRSIVSSDSVTRHMLHRCFATRMAHCEIDAQGLLFIYPKRVVLPYRILILVGIFTAEFTASFVTLLDFD